MPLPNAEYPLAGLREYLQASSCLDTLGGITQRLNAELEDSRRVMNEIRSMYDTAVTSMEKKEPLCTSNVPSGNMMDVEPPKLLLADMTEKHDEVDYDNVIAAMKMHAENIKMLNQNVLPPNEHQGDYKINKDQINLQNYASELKQLSKQVASIKTSTRVVMNRNPDLEDKLTHLCENVKLFGQMIDAYNGVGTSTENWSDTQVDNNTFSYDNIIEKLLSNINEVTYLLQSSN